MILDIVVRVGEKGLDLYPQVDGVMYDSRIRLAAPLTVEDLPTYRQIFIEQLTQAGVLT